MKAPHSMRGFFCFPLRGPPLATITRWKRPLILKYLTFPASNLLLLSFSLLPEAHYSQQPTLLTIPWQNTQVNYASTILIIILTVVISTLDPVGSQVPLGRGRHHHQCDNRLRKETAWKVGDGSRYKWHGCPHECAMIEYRTIENRENTHQDRRPVFHKNETRLLNRQLPHRGLEPSFELFSHSPFGLRDIQKM